jgi:hypothetical protein
VLNRGEPSGDIAVAGLVGKVFPASSGEGETGGFTRATKLIANDHHHHKEKEE